MLVLQVQGMLFDVGTTGTQQYCCFDVGTTGTGHVVLMLVLQVQGMLF